MSRLPTRAFRAVLVLAFVLPGTVILARAQEASSSAREAAFAQAGLVRSTAGTTREEERRRIQQLHAFLDAERPAGAKRAPVAAPVSASELKSIDDPDPQGRYKVGVNKALASPVAFAGERGRGVFTRTPDGGFVWTLVIASPNASAMRLRFANVSLPDDADLYVYNEFGDAKGPYQGTGPQGNGSFWSHTLAGDTQFVQVRFFGRATQADIRSTSVAVTHVGHLTARFRVVGSPEAFCSSPDGGNAGCIEDASCHNVSAVSDAKDAVALMLWPQGPFFFICSGGLVADTAGSQTPYFLTANHCISRQRDAQNAEMHFAFATDRCSNNYPIACDDWRNLIGNGVLGATLLATGSGSDFTLLRLSGAPPSGSAFLGWTTTPVATTNGSLLHRVSHPNAAPQAYSRQRVDTGAPTCNSLPRGNFIYSREDVGGTEGGSSGSPVVNGSGQLVGQLYGACGTNLGDVCDAGSNATVDGAFASYFGQVGGFLDPAPGAEVCDDGIDNDQDGSTDCADPDCAAHPACSGSSCAQKFEACVVDSDCCSNKCRGPAANKTCR